MPNVTSNHILAKWKYCGNKLYYTMTWHQIKFIQLCRLSEKFEVCCQLTFNKEEGSHTKIIRKYNYIAYLAPNLYDMMFYLIRYSNYFDVNLPCGTCLILELTDFHNSILQFLLHGLPHQPILPKCWVIRLLFIVMHQGIQSLLFHGASVILIIPTVDSQIFKKHGKNIGENIDRFVNKAF